MSPILDLFIIQRTNEAGEGWLDRLLDVANLSLGILKSFLSSTLALGLVLFSFLLLGLILSGWATLGWFLLGVLICAVPGWFACKLLYGEAFAKRLDSLGHTLIFGLLLTTCLSVIVAALGAGLSVSTMLIAALGSSLLLFIGGRWTNKALITTQDQDLASSRLAINIGLLVVLAIVAVPLFNVGRQIGDSYVYTPYFYRDFFRNIGIGAELAKGAVPPANPYFSGTTLHYYWYQMVFPALVYRMSSLSIALEKVFLLATLLVDITFVFILVHFLKHFIKHTLALMIVLGLAFAAESYQAPFKALLAIQPTFYALDGTWIGAIALPPLGFFFQGLIYLPHHFAALTAFVLVITLLLEQSSAYNKIKRATIAAIILFLASGFSFFIIAFGFMWAGTYLGIEMLQIVYRIWRNRSFKRYSPMLVSTIISGIILTIAGLAALELLGGLEMLLEGGTVWQFYFSKFQLMYPVRFLVMLGPMLVLGAAGVVVSLSDKQLYQRNFGLLWLLFITFFTIMFLFPANVTSGRWEVSQKLGLVVRLPLLAFSGAFLTSLINQGFRHRKKLWQVLLLFCFSALPNLLAYQYVHLSISNSALSVYVSAAEKRAAEWIRAETPPQAIVQAWPEGQGSIKPYLQPGGDGFPLIATFAERKGPINDLRHAQLYIPHLMEAEMQGRVDELIKLYVEPYQIDVQAIIEKYQIDYIYWGISEKKCCLENLDWYEKSSLFEKVYNQNGITIFRLRSSN